MSSRIAENLADVRRRIEVACARSSRSLSSVRLVAITKTVPAPAIRELVVAGHRLVGENRIQEALPKMDELGTAADWHFVGHLQTNKVRLAAGRFALIHGVDSVRLGREIASLAERAAERQAVLLQVNVSGEPSKFGVAERDVLPLLEALAREERLELQGLMTIPPPVERPEESRRWFARLRDLRDACSRTTGLALGELSMGMTDDFEVAIEEGATLVRIGRALFGARGVE